MPIVPVTNFRAAPTSTNPAELADVLAGTSTRYTALELVAGEADAILAALKVERPSVATRLVLADDEASLAADLTAKGKRLAFLRADEVGPEVRALSWGDKALFGVGRVKTVADWPLTAKLPAPAAADAYDPATTWTLFAGGDIMLDRGVYQTLAIKGKGADFPFDGGTADITGRVCCSSFGWAVPTTKRTGDAGAVRALIKGADIAVANFENPAPDKPKYHTSGTVFSADPRFLSGLADAGIDYVSLANNHIRDAGGAGLLQTIANIKKHGIAYSGAGKNLAAARTPAMLEAGGVKVAILGYDAIAGVISRHGDQDRQRAPQRQERQAGRGRRPQGRRRAGHRLPALGHRVRPDALRGQKQLARDDHRQRRRHGHRQPRPLGRRDGDLQGQADLVRARQLRVRPDLVGADDGGDHPRADVPRHEARPGPHPPAHHPGQGPAQLPRPGRRRQGRDGPGVHGLEGRCCPGRAAAAAAPTALDDPGEQVRLGERRLDP